MSDVLGDVIAFGGDEVNIKYKHHIFTAYIAATGDNTTRERIFYVSVNAAVNPRT